MEQSTGGGQGRARPPLAVYLRYGFRLSVLYCLAGLGVEAARGVLPSSAYEQLAAFLYGAPSHLLGRIGLVAPLLDAVVAGRVPPWLAGAASPAAGVALIFVAALAAWLLGRLAGLVLSFKQR